MTGLVLEGGAFRGLFTAGVLDALLDMQAQIPYIIGVSAGATNACSYISGQRGRNLDIMEKYLHHPRYLGLGNLVRGRALMDMDFVFDEIPHTGLPFDYETFYTWEGTFVIGVYNLHTGRTDYFTRDDLDPHSRLLRASCSIPLLFPFVRFGGGLYGDGGLGDPIPVKRAVADGCEKTIVVLTQPEGYEKRFGRTDALTVRRVEKKYPRLAKTLTERWQRYNEQVRLCRKLERQGKALILAPTEDFHVGRFERDKDKLRALYHDGLALAASRREEILSFLGRPAQTSAEDN